MPFDDDIVEKIYAAGAGVGPWRDVATAACDGFGGDTGFFYTHDTRENRPLDIQFHNWEPSWVDAYAKHYGALNPWAAMVERRQLAVGRPVVGEDIAPQATVLGSEFYADFLRPQRLTEHTGGLLVASEAGRVSVLGFMFATEARKLAALAPLERLASHVRGALRVGSAAAGALAEADLAHAAFDRLSKPIALVDREARVLRMNPAFEARVLEGRIAIEPSRRLRVPGAPEVGARLIAAIGRVTGATAAAAEVVAIDVARPWPLAIRVLSRRAGRPLAGDACADAIAMVMLASFPGERVATLRRLYGLTEAEAEVAALVADGRCLPAIAAIRGVKITTVRAYLNRVLAKTGCPRQIDLALMCARLEA